MVLKSFREKIADFLFIFNGLQKSTIPNRRDPVPNRRVSVPNRRVSVPNRRAIHRMGADSALPVNCPPIKQQKGPISGPHGVVTSV